MISAGISCMARKKLSLLNLFAVTLAIVALATIVLSNYRAPAPIELLNVSYDPTVELYKTINRAFAEAYKRRTGGVIRISQSHGGSSRQARQVAAAEMKPDVVTLGLPSDIDVLRRRGLVSDNWFDQFPNHARAYYSTIVFVVRKGNPRAVADWPDLVKSDIEVIFPDPKSSGNGKLAALAAWGSVVLRGGTERDAINYLKLLYAHAPFLVPAARGAGSAFAQEMLGDVHLAWENEALREVAESRGTLQVVYPPISILAEPAVARVDGASRSTAQKDAVQAYLDYLFTDEAQEIIAANGYRPYKREILERHAATLPPLRLFEIQAIAGSWEDAQNKFFADNGIIDLVYVPKPR